MAAKKSAQPKKKAESNGKAKLPYSSIEDGPVELVAAEQEEQEETLTPLFTINGKTYSMRPHKANVGLKYLWQVKTIGPDMAGLNLLETAVGKEGVEALMNFDGLEFEHFNLILRRLEAIVLGDQEEVGKDSENNDQEQPSAAGS